MNRPLMLLVDDSPADTFLIKEALRDNGNSVDLRCFSGGEELLQFLSASPAEHALILLDLNLPTMSGFEILSRLRAEPKLRHLPVVMWTTSSNPRDIKQAYQLGANSYLSKPDQYAALRETLALLDRYWNHFVASSAA